MAAVGFEPMTLGFLRLGPYSLCHQCGHRICEGKTDVVFYVHDVVKLIKQMYLSAMIEVSVGRQQWVSYLESLDEEIKLL